MRTENRLAGRVRISRWHGNDGRGNDTGITISLIDKLSGSECVKIHFPVESLGYLLTLQERECEFELLTSVVGKIAENREDLVPFNFTEQSKVKMDKALAPFEVNGWRARRDDMTNHHRCTAKGMQRVTFYRHVDPPQSSVRQLSPDSDASYGGGIKVEETKL